MSPQTNLVASDRYRESGYAHLAGFIPKEVANGFLARLKADLVRQGIAIEQMAKMQPLLKQPATELYGYHYVLMATFHWGMTPAIASLVGTELLPTYAYLRIYRKGDICKVHGDRPACEHSVSLTLAYSDDLAWPLEFACDPIENPYERADDDFRKDEAHAAVAMEAGDAVLYRGVQYHHGRTAPNPNAWSAHLFLHWVDRDGSYAENAFDGNTPPSRLDF